jgi:hypothetical protein
LRREYASAEKEIQIRRSPIPLNRILKVGQTVKYGELRRSKVRIDKKSARKWRVGKVEFVSGFFTAIRNKRGIIYTFTATDVFTNDVVIEGCCRNTSTLAEVLGIKEE